MVDGMSVSEAASWIGVPVDALARVLDGREAVSSQLASQLETAGWSRRDLWLRLQAAYDEAQARAPEGASGTAHGTVSCG